MKDELREIYRQTQVPEELPGVVEAAGRDLDIHLLCLVLVVIAPHRQDPAHLAEHRQLVHRRGKGGHRIEHEHEGRKSRRYGRNDPHCSAL